MLAGETVGEGAGSEEVSDEGGSARAVERMARVDRTDQEYILQGEGKERHSLYVFGPVRA